MTNGTIKWDMAALTPWLETIQTVNQSEATSANLTFEQLNSYLSFEQRAMVEMLLKIDPTTYGIQAPYLGLQEVPQDIVTISGQMYTEGGKHIAMRAKYLPVAAFTAFSKMKHAFGEANPGRTLLIESGYRSPAYQVLVFFNWLTRFYDGDMLSTLQHVALPAYSQHCLARDTAVDLKNIEGVPNNEHPENFGESLEYKWLSANAAAYGFYESYGQNNPLGMRWEPWHWQYRGDI